jgi:hypothetical protein
MVLLGTSLVVMISDLRRSVTWDQQQACLVAAEEQAYFRVLWLVISKLCGVLAVA